jgi:hypothetical protein
MAAMLLTTVILAYATEAMAFDLRQLIPGMSGVLRREANEKAQKQKQEEQARSCNQLKSWFDAGPLPIPAGSYPRSMDETNRTVMVLIEDGRFSAAFGKTYDQMTQMELQKLGGEVVPLCFAPPSGPLAGAYQNLRGVVSQILSPGLQANYVRQLNIARTATAELARLTDEVQALQPDDSGYARLASIRQAGDAATANAARPQVDAYAKAIAEAQQRVAAPVEAAQVSATVATANGYEGLARLQNLYTDLQRRSASNPATSDNLQALNARLNEIGQELAATERSRIDALGQGLVGLERGVQWQAEYTQRYRPYASQVRPLGELQGYFDTRRQATLSAASKEFSQAARHANSDAQLNALQQRYLLASDETTVAGTQMLTAIAEQRREMEKRAALAESRDEEQGEAPPSNAARDNAPAPQPSPSPRASGTASGEPSQAVMYDLVRARYEAEAARIKDLEQQCSGGRSRGDPTDAIVCLSVGLVGGVGADKPLKITHFEKLGCALASGKPGYYCEFDYTVTGGPSKFLGPITQSLTDEGGVGNARFLHKSSGWIMIYRTE